jgi:hypothetical protein
MIDGENWRCPLFRRAGGSFFQRVPSVVDEWTLRRSALFASLVGRRVRNLDRRIARIWVTGARRSGNGRKNRQREHG